MKKYTFKRFKLGTILAALAIAGTVVFTDSCKKRVCNDKSAAELKTGQMTTAQTQPQQQNAPETKTASIVEISKLADGSTGVIFKEMAEPFTVSDAASIALLQQAFNEKKPVNVTFDPWAGVIRRVNAVTDNEYSAYRQMHGGRVSGSSFSRQIDTKYSIDGLNDAEALGVLNTTTGGLTNVIPDMATAKLIFDYITHQCCALAGPYDIDYCISFQYCQDGCYARAHKMCWILNNRYNYATHKIFSFAYPSSTYTLSVQAQKWGGCCIRWWYHVAPLVNIKTPSGIKAYVFDPAMFNQPVLLATWLHAQENPVCAGSKIPKVTSINIQPTSSFWPNDTSSFDPDPTYYYTNSTLTNYAPRKTCP